jgi:hypothetical protein
MVLLNFTLIVRSCESNIAGISSTLAGRSKVYLALVGERL